MWVAWLTHPHSSITWLTCLFGVRPTSPGIFSLEFDELGPLLLFPSDKSAASTMTTLAIETSNPSAFGPHSRFAPGVALWSDSIRASEAIRTDDPHLDDLMASVERLCRRENVTPRNIKRVAVSIGPGGYTATRLAVTAAKMIAEGTGAACIAVPTARVVARRVEVQHEPFAVALASKGPTSFITAFDAGGIESHAGQLMDLAMFTRLGIRTIIADRFVPQEFADAAARGELRIIAPEFDPLACAELSVNFNPVDPVELIPLYPREPEAVTKWRELRRVKSL